VIRFRDRPVLFSGIVLLCIADLLALDCGIFLLGARETTGIVTGVRSEPSYCGLLRTPCEQNLARIEVFMGRYPQFFEIPATGEGSDADAGNWQPGRKVRVIHNPDYPERGYPLPALAIWKNSACWLACGLALALVDQRRRIVALLSGHRKP